ncbi:MAG: DUF3788 domain-containing protein [Acidobacteriia bacterium]|nr:DUF3788 domain-containing protein [Terriglobia bacterium]
MKHSNAFIGKASKLTETELAAELGASKALWDQLVDDLAKRHKLAPEWNSYSKKAGWSLRLKRGDRNIVYLSPFRGCFQASFALGDKAVVTALAGGLPKPVIKLIKEAKRYAEGTAVRIDVKGTEDVEIVKKLAAIKLAN